MERGRWWTLPLLLLALVATGCAGLQTAAGLRDSPDRPFDPATAIAVSVPSGAVYLVDPGSGRRVLVASGLVDFQAGYAAWAPDHHRLAYGDGGIVIVDTTTTGRRQVLARGGSVSMPAWSPDGKRIAYSDGTALYVTPVAKPGPVLVRLPEDLAPLMPAWSPAGAGGPATILFMGLKLDCATVCSSTERSEAYTVRADGSRLTQVTHFGRIDDPRWSPDGSRILLVRRFPSKPNRDPELWVSGPDGKDAQRLLAAPGLVAADWSPDGRRMVLARAGATPNTLQLWVAAADGSGARAVGDPLPGADATVDW
jgi:Tol biopolymer transport system component